MPFKYTPLPLLVIGALLMLVGAVWGPETKDVDFEASASPTPESPGADGSRTAPGTDRAVDNL